MNEWEIVLDVTCVVCPKCAFTFAAAHTDTDRDGYTCPNCNEGTNTVGIHNGYIALDRLGSIRRSLQRALDGTAREIEHRKADESYTTVYLSQLNGLAAKAAALEDEVKEKLNFA